MLELRNYDTIPAQKPWVGLHQMTAKTKSSRQNYVIKYKKSNSTVQHFNKYDFGLVTEENTSAPLFFLLDSFIPFSVKSNILLQLNLHPTNVATYSRFPKVWTTKCRKNQPNFPKVTEYEHFAGAVWDNAVLGLLQDTLLQLRDLRTGFKIINLERMMRMRGS